MNWGGLSVALGLLVLAASTAPWGLLVLAVLLVVLLRG